jgi:two-component system, NarL family, response regulator LiaR
LDSCEDFVVVGSAALAQEAIHLCQTLKPDILLVDFAPDMDSVEAIRQLRQHCPFAPIVVLTGSLWDDRMNQAIEAGASGWLDKGMQPDKVTEALRLAEATSRKRET